MQRVWCVCRYLTLLLFVPTISVTVSECCYCCWMCVVVVSRFVVRFYRDNELQTIVYYLFSHHPFVKWRKKTEKKTHTQTVTWLLELHRFDLWKPVAQSIKSMFIRTNFKCATITEHRSIRFFVISILVQGDQHFSLPENRLTNKIKIIIKKITQKRVDGNAYNRNIGK